MNISYIVWFWKKGDNYRRMDKICFNQLNLNTENKSEKVGERIVVPYDISNDEVYMENRRSILKYLEFFISYIIMNLRKELEMLFG